MKAELSPILKATVSKKDFLSASLVFAILYIFFPKRRYV